nr:innexin inx3 [Hydra vulgaris]
MSLITGSIKSILTIKIKHRHDSFSDQISRIFVAKMFLVASLVVGVDWFHDTVFCVLPKNSKMSENFVHSACWIQGFYIYPQMESFVNESAYHGIPQYVELDGISNEGNFLCKTVKKLYKRNTNCNPMERHYFAHFQWMPFYIASLAVLFYVPYFLFRIVNSDLISLQLHMKISEIDSEEIVQNYFNHHVNSKSKMRLRIFFNVIIKCMYVFVNLFAFKVLNVLLNGQFINYGMSWAKWLIQNASVQYAKGFAATPGNKMLPTFGFCDIHELSLDGHYATENKNKVICEISSNILYQYAMVLLWFVLVFGIFVSTVGLLENIFTHVLTAYWKSKPPCGSNNIYRYLTFRECEYLAYIRNKNFAVFGNVVRIIAAKNCLLKSVIPLHLIAQKVANNRVITKSVNGFNNSSLDDIGDCSPEELNFFRSTDHEMTKMKFKDRMKAETKYALLDDLLSGGL